MEDELRKLQLALAEEKRLREEEKRLREEETTRREEETTRREKAEAALQPLAPLSLTGYLDACHSLSLAIQVVTDRRSTTKGDATNPVGRIYPKRIVPWTDFPARQEEIWALLADGLSDAQGFPSQHQVDYVRSMIDPISSEQGLRLFEYNTVEHVVKKLVATAYGIARLRDRLGLRGTVTFESHTNLPSPPEILSDEIGRMSLGDGSVGGTGMARAAATPKRRRQPISTGSSRGMADQFCIYKQADDVQIPATAIEYKAPHKLSRDEVATGLATELQPARDIINQDGEGFVFAAKTLAAAVITQLFSYMIGKGIQYGYVCTGETFIFLHIPDDPTLVLYHVCVPNLDVVDDDENRLHRTAVAQVFAFILQSVRAAPPPPAWHDAAASLDKWDVEYDDILKKIPETVRTDKTRHTPYKAQKWSGPVRSPVRTRASCRPDGAAQKDDDEDDDQDSSDPALPPTPTRARPARSTNASGAGAAGGGEKQGGSQRRQKGKAAQVSIEERLYCTHACLRGLALGGPVDAACPNAAQHGSKHMKRGRFLRLLRGQLATDRGPGADAVPLYLTGSIGSMFKVRLSVSGYTLVAKGMSTANRTFLQGEHDVYDALRAVQGRYVPVCLGLIDLALPYHCNGGVFAHFLLLSWAGKSLPKCFQQVDQAVALSAVAAAFRAIHELRVLHGDAEPRNILFDAASGGLMVTDFERSTICPRRPVLGDVSPNSERKRKRLLPPAKEGEDEDAFAKELCSAVSSARCLYG